MKIILLLEEIQPELPLYIHSHCPTTDLQSPTAFRCIIDLSSPWKAVTIGN